MGQIVIRNQVPVYCNLAAIQNGGTKANQVLANGEIWLVDTTNANKTNGTGVYDAYIKGNGSSAAKNLTVQYLTAQVDLSAYSTTQQMTAAIQNAVSGKADADSVNTALAQQQAAINTLNGNTVVVVADHTTVSSPVANTIYREQGSTSYTDWMYDNNSWKSIATYSFPGIDEVVNTSSDNIIKSKAVANTYINYITTKFAGVEGLATAGVINSYVGGYSIDEDGTIKTQSSNTYLLCHSDVIIPKGSILQFTATTSTARLQRFGCTPIDPATVESLTSLTLDNICSWSINGEHNYYIIMPYDGYLFWYYYNQNWSNRTWKVWLNKAADSEPIKDSNNSITSGAVYDAIAPIGFIDPIKESVFEEQVLQVASIGNNVLKDNGALYGSGYSSNGYGHSNKIRLTSYTKVSWTFPNDSAGKLYLRILVYSSSAAFTSSAPEDFLPSESITTWTTDSTGEFYIHATEETPKYVALTIDGNAYSTKPAKANYNEWIIVTPYTPALKLVKAKVNSIYSDLYEDVTKEVSSVGNNILKSDTGALYGSGYITSGYSHSNKIKVVGETNITWSFPSEVAGKIGIGVQVYSSNAGFTTSAPSDFLQDESSSNNITSDGEFTVSASYKNPRWIAFSIQCPNATDYKNKTAILEGYRTWIQITSKEAAGLSGAIASFSSISLSQFDRIGVVGDSWSSGYIYVDGTLHADTYKFSWIANLARRNGVNWANYAVGGATVASWLGKAEGHANHSNKGITKLMNDAACDLYIVWWGANERSKGETYNIGSLEDINDSDYTQNADTFYGNTARCIQAIQAKANAAGISSRIVLAGSAPDTTRTGTTVADGDLYTPRIEIAEHFGIPIIYPMNDSWYAENFNQRRTNNALPGSHPDIMDNGAMALVFERLLSNCVDDNREYFSKYWNSDAFSE